MRSTIEHPSVYHPISKFFHWLIVVMLAIEFGVGFIMPGIHRSVTPAELVSFHMSFGICILGVMLLRLLWRLVYPVPAPEPGMPRSQESAASAVHYLLYASVIALPITGWWLASAHGWSVTVFNIITLAPLVAASSAMERLADLTHIATATIVAALIGLHILAALYHYFILNDKVLERMLPNK
jgi:cytochrome b561